MALATKCRGTKRDLPSLQTQQRASKATTRGHTGSDSHTSDKEAARRTAQDMN